MGKDAILVHEDDFFRLAMQTLINDLLQLNPSVTSSDFASVMTQVRPAPQKFKLLTLDKSLEKNADLKTFRAALPDLKIVVIGENPSQADALESIAAGAHGYVFRRGGPMHVIFGIGKVLNGSIFIPSDIEKMKIEQPQSKSISVEEYGLPPRQIEVWKCLSRGMPTKLIARELEISEGTVKIHLKALYKNLGVSNGKAAAALGATVFK